MKGRTTIIIAHRLSTISLADELVVLDAGSIVGRGTDEELPPDERRVPRHPRARPARARVRGARGGAADESGQPGGHLTRQRDAQGRRLVVARTARRRQDARDAGRSVQRQTALSPSSSLVAATATALVPPYLAKLAIDDGIRQEDLRVLTIVVALFVVAGVLEPRDERRADVLHRLDGRADPGRPAEQLPAPAAAVARLLRTEPRGVISSANTRTTSSARPARD